MTNPVFFDPGIRGAVALVQTPKTAIVRDLPLIGPAKQNVLDGNDLSRWLDKHEVDYAVIEWVKSMPKQGSSSTFRFGMAFGQIIGIVQALKIPHEFVTPQAWKGKLRLPAGAGKAEAVRRRAIERFPHLGEELVRQRDHNRAEALLLGLWWWENRATNRPPTGIQRYTQA